MARASVANCTFADLHDDNRRANRTVGSLTAFGCDTANYVCLLQATAASVDLLQVPVKGPSNIGSFLTSAQRDT